MDEKKVCYKCGQVVEGKMFTADGYWLAGPIEDAVQPRFAHVGACPTA